MRFFLLVCSPVPLLTVLSEAFPNFPVCIPSTESVTLFPYCMLLSFYWTYFAHSACCHDDVCAQLASLPPRRPHPLVPSSFDPWVLTIHPWKHPFPQSPLVHSSCSLHDSASSVSLTCTTLCPLVISEVLTLAWWYQRSQAIPNTKIIWQLPFPKSGMGGKVNSNFLMLVGSLHFFLKAI